MKMYKLPDGAVAVALVDAGTWDAFVCKPGLHDRPEGKVWRLPNFATPGEALEAGLSASGFVFGPGDRKEPEATKEPTGDPNGPLTDSKV